MKQIIYNELLLEKINKIVKLSKTGQCNSKCDECNILFKKCYNYKNIVISENDIHDFVKHSLINIDLYEKICKIPIKNYKITFEKIHTNDINIMDGLYKIGSNKIYISPTASINNEKNTKYSEHYGYITFDGGLKIVVMNDMRLDENDLDTFMPKNTLEFFKQQYIFHTHPRPENKFRKIIPYEFPSSNDILHFIHHHNLGVLKCSLIITTEGVYCIRKSVFNDEKIKFDKNIFTAKLENIMSECEEKVLEKYLDRHITMKYFYDVIMPNTKFIYEINKEIGLFGIAIDYYGRNLIENEYVVASIYLPKN